MSKYDWSGVPDWVVAIATCQDGSVKVFTKPTPLSNSWATSFSTTGIKPYNGNWKDSLEERPEYKDPVGICQSEGIKIAIKILEQALKVDKNE